MKVENHLNEQDTVIRDHEALEKALEGQCNKNFWFAFVVFHDYLTCGGCLQTPRRSFEIKRPQIGLLRELTMLFVKGIWDL